MRTCQDPVHQDIENIHIIKGQSRFQLQERLKRAGVSHLVFDEGSDVGSNDQPNNLYDDGTEEQEFEVSDPSIIHGLQEGISDPRGASPGRQPAPKKKITAQFGRKRTHNEQILVAPCGMILARETFYGAEAISTCAVRTCLNEIICCVTDFTIRNLLGAHFV